MFKLKSNYPQSFFTGAILRSKASLKQTTCILRVCLQIRGCSYKSLEFVNDLNTKKKQKNMGFTQLKWSHCESNFRGVFCWGPIFANTKFGTRHQLAVLPFLRCSAQRLGRKTQKGMPRNVKDTVDEIQQKNMLFRIPNCLWVPS